MSVQYYTTIKGKSFGVYVSNLTKKEATALLAGAAVLQRERNGGRMSAFEYAEFVDEVEAPRDLNSKSERWIAPIGAASLILFVLSITFHDQVSNLLRWLQ